MLKKFIKKKTRRHKVSEEVKNEDLQEEVPVTEAKEVVEETVEEVPENK